MMYLLCGLEWFATICTTAQISLQIHTVLGGVDTYHCMDYSELDIVLKELWDYGEPDRRLRGLVSLEALMRDDLSMVLAYKESCNKNIIDVLNMVLSCSYRYTAVFNKAVDVICLVTGSDFRSRVTDDLIRNVFFADYYHTQATLQFALHFFTNGASHPDMRAKRVINFCDYILSKDSSDATIVDLVFKVLLALFAHLELTTVTTTVTRSTPISSKTTVTTTTPDKNYHYVDATNVLRQVDKAMKLHAPVGEIQTHGRDVILWLVRNTKEMPLWHVRDLGLDGVV